MKFSFCIALSILFYGSIHGQEVTIVSPAFNSLYNLRDFCISPDGKEAYFTIQSPNQNISQIVCVYNKKWDQPVLLPFCDGNTYLEPFLSADGNRLYFASDRPGTRSDTAKRNFDIWYVERKDRNSSWSKPVNMGQEVNSDNDEFYPTLADNGNLYFTMESTSGFGKDDIYYCTWNGTAYSRPVLLDSNINSEGYEFNAFISGDESFLIYTRYNAADGFGSGDLYISRKDEKGAWKKAVNMGNVINTRFMEYCPFYDDQNGILYFTSKRDKLTPQKFTDAKQFLDRITGAENGLSKIYKYYIKL